MAQTIGSLDLNAFSDLYSDSNQYFWFESNSSATYGAGVHVTLSPDASFIANPSGQNILMNTDGISIRNGLLPMMTLDNDSLDFNVINTTAGTYTNVASFGSTTTIGGASSRIVLSEEDIIVYGENGQLAKYGASAIIGDENDFHITVTSNYYASIFNPTGNPSAQGWYELDGNEYVLTEDTTVATGKTYYRREPRLSFYRNAENEVDYISGKKLYITQSVVLQQMDVGMPTSEGGLGQWSWKVHEVNDMNNLYLKWLG